MPQKLTASFFENSVAKKVEGVENSTKTKKDTSAASNANDGAKKSQDDIKQNGVEEAVNPTFKRKSSSVERDAENRGKKTRSAENPNHKLPGEEKENQKFENSKDTSVELLTANGMENLAPEILINIFGLLPFDDLKSAILVCRFVL